MRKPISLLHRERLHPVESARAGDRAHGRECPALSASDTSNPTPGGSSRKPGSRDGCSTSRFLTCIRSEKGKACLPELPFSGHRAWYFADPDSEQIPGVRLRPESRRLSEVTGAGHLSLSACRAATVCRREVGQHRVGIWTPPARHPAAHRESLARRRASGPADFSRASNSASSSSIIRESSCQTTDGVEKR